LATALEIGKLETLVNKVRFAWWGAEGSTFFFFQKIQSKKKMKIVETFDFIFLI